MSSNLDAAMRIRIARPTRSLAVIEKFWVEGVGLDVLWRSQGEVTGGHQLLMVGVDGASWHLELVEDAASVAAPSDEDLLVLYLGTEPANDLLERIAACGGQVVPSRNPYWDEGGKTVLDPDGYRLVLAGRTWR